MKKVVVDENIKSQMLEWAEILSENDVILGYKDEGDRLYVRVICELGDYSIIIENKDFPYNKEGFLRFKTYFKLNGGVD